MIQLDHIKTAHLDLTHHGYDRFLADRGLDMAYKFFSCVQLDSDSLAVYTSPDTLVTVTIVEVGDRMMLRFSGDGASCIRDKFAARLQERKDWEDAIRNSDLG